MDHRAAKHTDSGTIYTPEYFWKDSDQAMNNSCDLVICAPFVAGKNSQTSKTDE